MMAERQDPSLEDHKGRQIVVTVSTEFMLVKIETERAEITMTLAEFEKLANWVLKR